MSRSKRSLSAVCLSSVVLGAVALVAPAAVSADVLVMRDGSRVETEGTWETRGRLIRFTLPNGTLGSVRADEVDLEASEEATRVAAEEAAREASTTGEEAEARAPREKPEPVLVLTDKDIARAESSVVDEARSSANLANVRVLNWEYREDEGGNPYRIVGTVRNVGFTGVEDIIVSVKVIGVDSTGEAHSDVVVEGKARLDVERLDSGDETEFEFPLTQRQLIGTGNPSFFANPRVELEVKSKSEGESAEG